MATYLPTPGALPSGWCPSTWQTVLNQFAALLPIVINGEDEVIIQADTPGVDDRGKVWIKTLDVAPWVDSIRIWVAEIPPSGDWRPIPGQPVYFVDTGAADSMVVDTGENLNSELFLTGRIWMVKANNTNTGPVTLTVDSIAAKGVKKQNNVDMEAGDFVAGQILLLAFDPVSNVFEVVNTLTPEAPPAPVYVDSTGLVKLAPDQPTYKRSALAGTAEYNYILHGMPGVPSYWKWVLKYVGAGTELYSPGDEVEIPIMSSPEFRVVGNMTWATSTEIRVATKYPASAFEFLEVTVPTDFVLTAHAYYIPTKEPEVITQPVSLTKSAGQNASFTVVAAGDTPITYQWQRNGVNIFDGVRLSGTATATLTITGAVDGVPPGGDEANYSCVLTNTVGTVSSNTASLTVT